MKKSVKILLLVLAVLLALTGVGLFAVTRLDARAKQEHAALSGAVEARMNWISGTRVALTENGAEIGSYTLEDLGLSQSAQAAATNGLSQIDLLPEAEFEALGIAERLSWHAGASAEALDAPLDLPLRRDAVQEPHQQVLHDDHRVNGRATVFFAVKRGCFLVNKGQIQCRLQLSEEVLPGH